MNFTIFSLCSTFLSNTNIVASSVSPVFSLAWPTSFTIHKSIFSHFFSSIISLEGVSEKIIKRPSFSINLSCDKFSFFLKTPIIVSNEDFILEGDYNAERYISSSDTSKILIKRCHFSNIQNQNDGGAIYINLDVETVLQSTIFENIQVSNQGGAIYYNGGDSPQQKLYSNYNCVSNCMAKEGSVIKAKGGIIEIYFLGTTMCTGTLNQDGSPTDSSGAQIDLESFNISTSNLNLTGALSKVTSTVEYRKASSGFFKYETIINCSGCYTIALTETGEGLLISSSNIIDCTVTNNPYDGRPCIIFQNMGSSKLHNFCVFGCDVKNSNNNQNNRPGKLVANHIEQNGETEIIDLITDLTKDDVNYGNPKITVSGNSVFEQSVRITNEILQLNLGDCAGDVIAPDLINQTPTESPYPTVTASLFLTSKPQLTKTHCFSETEKFTFSDLFSETKKFTFSDLFSETKKFTFSEYFSPSRFIVSITEKEGSLDLSNGQVIACLATPSLFFLLLIGIVVFIIIAKNIHFKKKNIFDEEFDDEETLSEDEKSDDKSISIDDDQNEQENADQKESHLAFWTGQKEIYNAPS